ncbi:MAG: FecR domain-containing protein [Treponema sp.]|jgi:hypothetical protein|nr:FecR domain-containing protein [Treponema sp.]
MKTTMRTTAFALLVLGASLLHAQEGAAYILECSGTVEVKTPGATEWKAAETGALLTKDTVISTGFRSTARIALGNSTLIVRPLTRLSLEELQTIQGHESVNLFVQTGRVRAEVNPPTGGRTDFTVRGPVITASVRGTSFDFDGLILNVTEGLVHVTGGDGSAVYVGAGHQAASDPVTGRTAGGAETARAELTPPPPVAAGEAVTAGTVIVPAGTDRNVGFAWNGAEEPQPQ